MMSRQEVMSAMQGDIGKDSERPDGSLRVEVEFRIEVEGSAKPWVTGIKVGRFFFD